MQSMPRTSRKRSLHRNRRSRKTSKGSSSPRRKKRPQFRSASKKQKTSHSSEEEPEPPRNPKDIPPFPYEQHETWLLTTLNFGRKATEGEVGLTDVEKGTQFVCYVDRKDDYLLFPFEKKMYGYKMYGYNELNGQKDLGPPWLPHFSKVVEWKPFEDSINWKWERVGESGDILKKVVELAQGFQPKTNTAQTLHVLYFKNIFVLYSRAEEYKEKDNTTVVSAINAVATMYDDKTRPEVAHHAPAMVAMLIAYPEKLLDVLESIETWKPGMLDAFVNAMVAMLIAYPDKMVDVLESIKTCGMLDFFANALEKASTIGSGLEIIRLVDFFALKSQKYHERLSELSQKMHRAFIKEKTLEHNMGKQ